MGGNGGQREQKRLNSSMKAAYLSTHTVYPYKIKINQYFGGIWPY